MNPAASRPNRAADPPARIRGSSVFRDSSRTRGSSRFAGSSHSGDSSGFERHLPWLAALAAVAVTLPALTGQFVWDDRWLIVGSPLRQDPGLLLQVAFEGHGWGTMSRPEAESAYFRPLANLVHGVLVLAAGAKPLPFRILSTLLHAGCALLLALWLRRRHPRAAWGAVLFAVHPVAADAFGWISAAPDLMATGFLLAVLLALDRPRAAWLPAGFCWLLALLSKESAIAGALWIPLLWLGRALSVHQSTWPAGERGSPAGPHEPPLDDRRRTPVWPALRRPLAAMAAATLVYLLIRASGPGFHPPIGERPPGVGASGIVLTGRLLLADLQRILWPVRLTLAPPGWVVAPGQAWTGIAGATFGLGLAAASLVALRRPAVSAAVRGIALGVALCLTALLPVLQITPTNDIFGGRFLYLPLAGLCLGIGLAVAAPGPRLPAAARAAAILVLCLLAIRTGVRAADWRSDEALFGGEYRRQPQGLRTEILWAGHLLNGGRVDEARPVVESLTRKHPEEPPVRYLRALVLMNSGGIEEAAAIFERLAAEGTATPTLLSNLAACQMRLGRVEEGLATLDRATERLTPTPGMRNNRGLALKLLGRHDEARGEFVRASREDPAYEPARVNLISLLVLDQPDPPAARREAEDFLRRFPQSPRAGIVRGLLDSLRVREARGMRGTTGEPIP